jgi:K+-transporting ATPase KdpF subunit
MAEPRFDRAKGDRMNLEYIISGIIVLGLLWYLMYALLRPEKF